MVKGRNSYSIYLNGQPYRVAQTSPIAVLQSIPASTVSKIEVITELDGRHDSDTGDAIINIITIRRHLDNYIITINGGINTQPKANAGITLIGTNKNMDFSVGYNYNVDTQRRQPVKIESEYSSGNVHQKTHTDGIGDGYWGNHVIRALMAWSMDSLNNLYLDGHSIIQKTNFSTRWDQKFISQNNPPVHSIFINDNRNTNGTVETNIIYRNFFRQNKNIERFVAGYRYTYNPDVRTFIQYRNADTDMENKIKNYTNGGLNEHTFMGNVTILPSSQHTIQVGVKHISRLGNLRTGFHTWNENQWQPHSVISDNNSENMNYDQNISSLHGSYTGNFKELTLNASLRWEYAVMRVNSQQIPSFNHIYRQPVFIPRLSLSYRPNDTNSLSLNYSGGLQRPSILMLNPFRYLHSEYIATEGNPNLLDAHINSTYLEYMRSADVIFLSCGISYSSKKNPIIMYNFYDPYIEQFINQYRNITSSNEFGVNLYFNYRPISALSLTITGNIAQYNLKDEKYWLKQSTVVYNVTSMCDISLKNHWIMGLQYGNYKNYPDAWSRNDTFSIYSCYIGKSFLEGSLNVRAVINSPFNKYNEIKTHKIHPEFYSHQTNFATAW